MWSLQYKICYTDNAILVGDYGGAGGGGTKMGNEEGKESLKNSHLYRMQLICKSDQP